MLWIVAPLSERDHAHGTVWFRGIGSVPAHSPGKRGAVLRHVGGP